VSGVFSREATPRQRAFDNAQELVADQRFLDEVASPGADSLDCRPGGSESRHDDHGNADSSRAKHAQNVDARQIRQVKIREHEIGSGPLDGRQAFSAGFGCGDLEATTPKELRKTCQRARVVVDNQHLLHATRPLWMRHDECGAHSPRKATGVDTMRSTNARCCMPR
jgi:hypothetical protein